MSKRRSRRRRAKSTSRISLWVYVALLAFVVGTWFGRAPIVESIVVALIEREGYGPASLKLTRIDLGGAEVADLEFRLGSIGHLAIDYQLNGDLTRIHIADADLNLSALPPQDEAAEMSLAIPAQKIALERVRITAGIPGGEAVATIDGLIETLPVLSGEIDFALTTPTGDLTGQFQAGLQPDGGLKGKLDVAGGDLNFADIAVSGLSVAAAFGSAEGGLVTEGSFSLDASAGIKVGVDYAAEPAAKALTGRYSLKGETLTLEELGGSLQVNAAKAAGIGHLETGTIALLPEGSSVTYDLGEGAYSFALATSPFALDLGLEAAGETVPVSIAGERLSLSGDAAALSLIVSGGGLTSAGHNVAVSGIDGTLKSQGDDWRIEATIATLRHLGEPALITPISAEIAGRLRAGLVEGKISAAHGTEPVAVAAIVKHNLADRTGEAAVTLDRVTLDDVSIKSLSPAYADTISAASGIVSLTGPVRWGPDGLGSDIAVVFEDVGFKNGTVTVSTLNGSVVLDSLVPPGTRPTQHLTAVLDIKPVGKMPVDLKFHVKEGKIEVETVDLSVFGGAITARAASFDASKGSGGIDLQLTEIDLAAIFDLIDLEEVSGTGRVSGGLPVRLERGRVAISAGKLKAGEPGTLRISGKALAGQLGGAGETVDLAIQALSNFEYERLELEADKPFEGDGVVKFKIEGANPDVLDGHPFVFNVNLTSDFDKLASVLFEVAKAADKALQWGTQQGKR